MRHCRRGLVLAAILALAPGAASANGGIGFFMPASMVLVFAIIPVVVVEGLVLRWRLPVGWGRAFTLAAVANVVSTLVGALIGFGLDLLIAGAGVMGGAGPIGFLVSMVLMFGISWWLEYLVVARNASDLPNAPIGRAVLIANAISYVLLAIPVALLVPHDSMTHRSRVTEAINLMGVEKTGIAEHYQSRRQWPQPKTIEAPTPNVRRMRTDNEGRILAELKSPLPELDGKVVAYAPRLENAVLVGWECYVPEAPLKYFPAMCRQRKPGELQWTR